MFKKRLYLMIFTLGTMISLSSLSGAKEDLKEVMKEANVNMELMEKIKNMKTKEDCLLISEEIGKLEGGDSFVVSLKGMCNEMR